MKIEVLYGMNILNPTVAVKYLPPPPPTKMEIFHDMVLAAFDLFWPPFLFALSMTAFRLSLGGW